MSRERTGEGFRRAFCLRPGLDVCMADFTLGDTVERSFESTSPVLRFYFHVAASGYWELNSSHRPSSEKKIVHSDRLSTVLFYPELEGKMHLPAQCRQFHVSIAIAPSLLMTYLDGCLDRLPVDLRDIAEGSDNRGFYRDGEVSRMMHTAIDQLLLNPYSGPMGRLYMESKVMELIAHKLEQIGASDFRTDSEPRLTLDDVARVSEATKILARDLANPPRLFDLARTVGTNHSKLNQGFREVCGTTVFGYLRRLRLMESKRLLEKEDMNVTEAALSVGYSSIPSFSRAFLEFFGQPPKMCLAKRNSGKTTLGVRTRR